MARKQMDKRTSMIIRLSPEMRAYLVERADRAFTSANAEAARCIAERMQCEKPKANRARTSARA
jgi:hypothetical protein